MTTIKLSNDEYLNADKIKRFYYSSNVIKSRKEGSSEGYAFLNDDHPDYYLKCSILAEVRDDDSPLLCCKKFPANRIARQTEKERSNFMDEGSFQSHLKRAIVTDPKLIETMDELLENTINIIESAKKSDLAILDLNNYPCSKVQGLQTT